MASPDDLDQSDPMALARAALSAGVAMDAEQDAAMANPHGLASPADNLTDRQAEDLSVDLVDADGNRLMSAAEFSQHAGDLLGMLSGITGLKSLAIPPDLEGRAAPAWGVMHTYLQKWAPSVLRPVDGWISDAFVVGMFVVPWGQSIHAEVKERRAEKADRIAAMAALETPQAVKVSGGTIRPGVDDLASVAASGVPDMSASE